MLSLYIYYYIIEKVILSIVNNVKSTNSIKEKIVENIPNNIFRTILESIEYKLLDYLKRNKIFNLDGFICFRLKSEFSYIKEMVFESYSLLNNQSTEIDSIDWIKDHYSTEQSNNEVIFISYENGNNPIVKKEDGTIIFEDEDDEISLVAYVIHYAPKFLNVIDPEDKMNSDLVILLKETFKERVVFSNYENYGCFNRKSGK